MLKKSCRLWLTSLVFSALLSINGIYSMDKVVETLSETIEELDKIVTIEPWLLEFTEYRREVNIAKKVYYKLTLICHPDIGGTEKKFEVIGTAYEAIVKKQKDGIYGLNSVLARMIYSLANSNGKLTFFQKKALKKLKIKVILEYIKDGSLPVFNANDFNKLANACSENLNKIEYGINITNSSGGSREYSHSYSDDCRAKTNNSHKKNESEEEKEDREFKEWLKNYRKKEERRQEKYKRRAVELRKKGLKEKEKEEQIKKGQREYDEQWEKFKKEDKTKKEREEKECKEREESERFIKDTAEAPAAKSNKNKEKNEKKFNEKEFNGQHQNYKKEQEEKLKQQAEKAAKKLKAEYLYDTPRQLAGLDILNFINESYRISTLGSHDKSKIEIAANLDKLFNVISIVNGGFIGLKLMNNDYKNIDVLLNRNSIDKLGRFAKLLPGAFAFKFFAHDSEIVRNANKIAKCNRETNKDISGFKIKQFAWLTANKVLPYLSFGLSRKIHDKARISEIFGKSLRSSDGKSVKLLDFLKAAADVSEIVRKCFRNQAERRLYN